MSQKKLGKSFFELGLTELLSDFNKPVPSSTKMTSEGLIFIPIQQLVPSRIQPRRYFDETSLLELAQSIKSQGILQPIIIRKLTIDQYEIIAGERRWRAAQKAGLEVIPGLIKELSDREAMAVALIENLQRKDLNVLEEAEALQRLMEDFQLTHQEIADTVGKSRSAISNMIRLLNLSPAIKQFLISHQLEMAHARTLLPLSSEQQLIAAEHIINQQLTVREAESYVNNLTNPNKQIKSSHKNHSTIESPEVASLEQNLTIKLDTKVSIKHQSQGSGKLTIHYKDWSNLQKLLQILEW